MQRPTEKQELVNRWPLKKKKINKHTLTHTYTNTHTTHTHTHTYARMHTYCSYQYCSYEWDATGKRVVFGKLL